MIKNLLKYCVLFCIFLFFINCKKNEIIIHKSTDGSVKEYNNWFAQDANFQKKKEYKEKFLKAYNEAITKEDYKKASELLLSAFQIMSLSGVYDDYYVTLLYDYVKKYESKNSTDNVLSFYVFLGQYETNNNNNQKCISLLQKVSAVEPYNYHTFSEKGNVHYYLSFSYFNLGEVDKAMIENKKAIAFFNRTDNYNGQALVMHNKATISYNSWNESEAIEAIDKTIKIYKKNRLNFCFETASSFS